MFTFGSLGDDLVQYQTLTALLWLVAVFLALVFKKYSTLKNAPILILFLITVLLIPYILNFKTPYFYAVRNIDGHHIELIFEFPKQHVKKLTFNQITDIKFGMSGKPAGRCYVNIYADDEVYTSQTDHDCEKVKNFVRKIQGDMSKNIAYKI